MIILDGKQTSNNIKDEIALAVQNRKSKGLKIPHLAAIIVGSGSFLTNFSNFFVQ